MFVRSSRILLLFLAAALVGLALLAGALVWQLSRGPIGLGFLTPFIEDALASGEAGAQVRLHDTVLTWDGEDRSLDIRAVGLELVDGTGRVRATVPQMSVRFSARAALRGLIAPTSLELFGPRLRVVRDESGRVSFGYDVEGEEPTEATANFALVEDLLRPPDPRSATGYLRRVAVTSAYVEIEDAQLGLELVAPRVNVAFERDATGIAAEGSLSLGEGARPLRIEGSGLYRSDSGTGEVGLAFEDVRPEQVARFHPALSPFAALAVPIDGTLTLSFGDVFALRGIGIDLAGGPGTVDLAAVSLEPVSIAGFALQARAAGALTRLDLDSFLVDLGGPTLALSGNAVRADGRVSIEASGRVEGFPADDIGRFWPAGIEDTTREWITGNISTGTIDSATVEVFAVVPEAAPAEFEMSSLSGEIRASGATIHYLRPMEPIRGVSGHATFDQSAFLIDVETGNVRGLVAEKGRIEIHGLDGPPKGETIRIEATAVGPVRDALEILDEEPLGFVRKLGVDSSRTKGDQRTNLAIAFPLLEAITVDEIAVAAASRLVNFAAEDAMFGLPVAEGDFSLNVDRKGLKLSGTAHLSDVPVGLSWDENFEDSQPVRTRYEVRAVLDEAARGRLGVDAAPFVEGPMGVGLTYVGNRDGTAVGAADIDLTDTTLTLDAFGWRKPAGTEGRAFVRFLTEGGALVSVPEFRASSTDLAVEGSASLRQDAEGTALQRLSLPRLAFGETDVFATVDFPSGGPPVVALGGKSLDLRRVVETMFEDEEGLPALRIVVSDGAPLESVRLGEETRLAGLRGHLVRDEADWRDVELRAGLVDAGRLYMRIEPREAGRHLVVESDDAGGVLNALDWVDTIKRGEMRVLADFREEAEGELIVGQLNMQNFVLTEEPLAAKILALASFSGIADVLRGEGITFRRAEVPFEIRDDLILVKGAKARGADVGILASGRIDRQADTLDINGEIAPAYTLNSILANIPLLGTVLSGGAGDGIFAATFSANGPLDSPQISVNPLAVLTPGIIRRLFTGFSEEGDAGNNAPARPPASGEDAPDRP